LFSRIAVDSNSPYFEMHTSQIYKDTHLLLIGGRSHVDDFSEKSEEE
jgi:hypothetical protein